MEKPLRQEKQVVVSVKSLPGCFPAVSLWLLGPSGFHPSNSALGPDVWMFVLTDGQELQGLGSGSSCSYFSLVIYAATWVNRALVNCVTRLSVVGQDVKAPTLWFLPPEYILDGWISYRKEHPCFYTGGSTKFKPGV